MNRHPEFIVFAGPNGSGKSTLIEEVISKLAEGAENYEYINVDYFIKMDIPEIRDSGNKARAAWDHVHAYLDWILSESRPEPSLKHYIWETVFSHESRLEYLRKAKNAGYYVVVHFVATIDPEINKRRVLQRIAAGGHGVDPEKIVSRYGRSVGFLPEIVQNADEATVYDNSYDRKEPMPVFFSRKDEKGIMTEVTDEELTPERAAWIRQYLILPLEAEAITILNKNPIPIHEK